MADNTKTPSENTKLFSSLPPEVAVLIIDVIDAVASVLAWRQSSKSLLSAILSRLAERDYFEKEHKNFSYAMWPHLEVSRRKEKFSRWLSNFKSDQKLSKIDLVWVENRRVKRDESGEFKGLPTLYRRGKFWDLFSCVQFVAKKCDLLDFPVDDRRAQVREIVANWLKEAGAIKIIREKKEKPERTEKQKADKSDSLLCKCDCGGCKKCSLKTIATPESEPVLSVQIEQERARFREIEEDFVSIGQAMLNRGGKLSVADNKINAVSNAARARLKAAVNHKNGRSDYAPNAGERALGRAGLDAAIEGLSDALRAANRMERYADVEILRELRTKIQMLEMFRNNKAGLKLVGGQPK